MPGRDRSGRTARRRRCGAAPLCLTPHVQHHEDTLAAYVAAVSASPETVAVVATGSAARGTERPDSDVDVYLVVTEPAFARAEAAERLSYVDAEVATYDGGYVDVKVVTTDYLRRAAVDGDDPVRASFHGARVVWTRVAEVHALVAAIPVLPEEVWEDRAASFVAQMRLYGGYFLRQGEQLGETYLRHWAAVHLVGSAGRALLARGRVLFQGHKYLTTQLAALPDLPDGYLALAERVLHEPTAEHGRALMDAVEAHHAWAVGREQTLSRFVRENELAWLTRVPPPEFR